MFTVEWLKEGRPIHRESMLGAKLGDTLRLAHSLTTTAKEASGVEPDAVRVTDHMTNRTVVEKIANA